MSSLRPRTILLAGWLLFLLATYPGFLFTENANQMMDARLGVYLDEHDPVFTALWRIVSIVMAGPAGMLLIQSGLLLLGAFWLLRRATSERTAAIAAACVLVFPPVLAITGVVCPEVLTTGLVLLGIELLARERKDATIAALGAFVLACGILDIAWLALLPIVLVLFRWPGIAGWRRWALALVTWLLVIGAAAGIERLLVDQHTDRKQVLLAMHDVIGTLRFAPPLPDAQLRTQLDDARVVGPNLQERARDIYGRTLFYDTTERRLFEPAASDDERDAVLAARHVMILQYPAAYLRHRWFQTWRFLRMSPPLYASFVEKTRDAHALSHLARHSALQRMLLHPPGWLARTMWFKPFLYVLLTLVLLPLAIARRQQAAAVLLGSGVAYTIGLLLFTTRVQQRDAHWLIVAAVLAVILSVVRPATARP